MSPTRLTRRARLTLGASAIAAAVALAFTAARPDSGVVRAASPAAPVQTGNHAATHGKADAHATLAPSTTPVSNTPKGAPPDSARAKRRTDRGLRPGETIPRPARQEEVENGETSNGYSGKNMAYHGGATQATPRIYLVLWGPNWFSGGDPYGVANRLHYFYQGVGGSTWANALKQFTSNSGTFSNPAGQYRGWLQDSSPVPAQPTRSQVATAAQRAAVRMNDFSHLAQYVIVTPYGVVDQYSSANGFCAWHDWVYASGWDWVTFTSLPYTPYLDDLGRGCGGYKVNGGNGRLDGVTINAAHEYAESVNDPGLDAWYDVDKHENADKCSWVGLKNYTLANNYAFPVQPYWSNIWRNTYGYGCYYS
jgi:hypothetical protein